MSGPVNFEDSSGLLPELTVRDGLRKKKMQCNARMYVAYKFTSTLQFQMLPVTALFFISGNVRI